MREQHPVPAPRYRFRPRNDRYTLPTFRDGQPPRINVQRYETTEQTDANLIEHAVLVGICIAGLLWVAAMAGAFTGPAA